MGAGGSIARGVSGLYRLGESVGGWWAFSRRRWGVPKQNRPLLFSEARCNSGRAGSGNEMGWVGERG